MAEKKFTAIIDTREQQPLRFYCTEMEEVVVATLKTGDYTIQGLEDVMCIERKATVLELYNNINEARFWRELERMQKFKYRFLVLEFTPGDVDVFPEGAKISDKVKEKLKMGSKYLMRKISEIQVNYGINVLFAEDRQLSAYMIGNIMRRVNEIESKI
jgi:ERCC4-type nuclease